ncbi:MAG: hypothetical protein IPJ76_04845 [Flavobacteriales bacterium]|nr:MAG: hypothetical protein IPJ76_04845 [Flavobacteriales bacterium]
MSRPVFDASAPMDKEWVERTTVSTFVEQDKGWMGFCYGNEGCETCYVKVAGGQ